MARQPNPFRWVPLLATAVSLVVPVFRGQAQSPASIGGRTIQMTISNGSSPFAASGSFRFLPSAADNAYAIVPVSGNVAASTGTHTYAKTGATTAGLSLLDSVVGELTANCTFNTPNSGTYVLTIAAVPGASQTGTFVLYAGASPSSIAGTTITITITSGEAPFGSFGSYRFLPAATGDTYNIVALSGDVADSSGTYSYSKNSDYTGFIAFSDSRVGQGLSSQLSFDTPTTGTAFLRKSGSTGYQTAVFSMTTPVVQTPGRVTIARDRSQVTLSWDCVSGRRYQLLSTAHLGGLWEEVATQPKPLVASGNRLSYTLSLTLETQFYRVAELVESTPSGLVWIPPGTFSMGSPSDEVDRFDWEGPQTEVTISRGFWMGKCEVTQGEYLAVMGSNPSWCNGVHQDWPEHGTNTDYAVDLNRPVETVTWYDATNYCGQLTQQERAAGRIATNSVYRLPREAESEYACPAGTTTRFSYGDDPGYTNLTKYDWCSDNSDNQPHPVGQKLPNPWGLSDMHGNVWEWCQDWWSVSPPGGIALDPQGPPTGSNRVVRGGDWDGDDWNCRSAFRASQVPGSEDLRIGFRVVLAPGQP